MKIVKYNPLNDFIPSTFGSILENAINNGNENYFEPAVDFVKNDKSFELHVAAPGLEKSDFEINMNEDTLTISGERKRNESTNYTRVESNFGKFKRSFKIGDSIDKEKIKAAYLNGILKVELPINEKKLEKKTIKID
ncbi:Hsp20/alpha crystallin family protein [Fulvivirga lutea]|uniref:Hsp20/alpha crystallin family protein n=1 Tax=Fulvivirga lutea TaxID=2810512 RepID=A0A975A0V6_9BACT|nr:Hsp20/alpha crystallin family protein [Fulvivirga lutea]QSE97600.1 Hsp20/alpha crystallin family protein [Fulvivirga lutea]